jgi:hypothetical protein
VQGTKLPADIRVEASSPGLETGMAVVASAPAPSRAAL